MRATVTVDHLDIDKVLYDFVNEEAMPGTGLRERPFWSGFGALVRALAPRNAELLLRRDRLQSMIDAWHRQNPGPAFDRSRYKAYLLEIGYLVPEKQPFAVDTASGTEASPGRKDPGKLEGFFAAVARAGEGAPAGAASS